MSERIEYFLLVFDRSLGQLIDCRQFGEDEGAAVLAYENLETEHQANDSIEVVLIGSDSLETIKVTHANYFYASDLESKYFAGL